MILRNQESIERRGRRGSRIYCHRPLDRHHCLFLLELLLLLLLFVAEASNFDRVNIHRRSRPRGLSFSRLTSVCSPKISSRLVSPKIWWRSKIIMPIIPCGRIKREAVDDLEGFGHIWRELMLGESLERSLGGKWVWEIEVHQILFCLFFPFSLWLGQPC